MTMFRYGTGTNPAVVEVDRLRIMAEEAENQGKKRKARKLRAKAADLYASVGGLICAI